MIPFEEFQLFRKILCVCPCCGELVRISDLHLKDKKPVEKTWLDDYEAEDRELAEKEDAFKQQEKALKAEANAKGLLQAQKTFQDAICPSIRKMKFDPRDIKPILNPIDYVVFRGMSENNSISDIIFLTREHQCTTLNGVRCQIKKAIENEKYDWQVARMEDTGKIVVE
jgi:predicted Holliday junction resolvase-like endonuclease